MYEKFSNALRRDRNHSASSRTAEDKYRRGLMIEFLLGGFHLPGFIEYDARADQVTFTLRKKSALLLTSLDIQGKVNHPGPYAAIIEPNMDLELASP